MRIFVILILLLIGCLPAAGCASDSKTAGSTDWYANFVVWDGDMYQVTKEMVEVEESIGEVELYSSQEIIASRSKVFSNVFPAGTKIYKIKNVSIDDAIAVRKGNGDYIKAENHGRYGGKK